MPTPPTAKWPKPKSEDEFEDIVVDFVRIRWRDPHATRNGRRGQRQDGVDVFGHPSWLKGRTAGAQCKNTESVTLAIVCAEVEKAKKFKGGLAEFLLVTTAERDARLQSEVREHFKSQPAPFHVDVVFWPDVVADLAGDPQLVDKHWKGFLYSASQAETLSPPTWIGREGVHDKETSECQCELTLLAPGLDLAPSEVVAALGELVHEREGSSSPFQRLLAHTAFQTLRSKRSNRIGDRYIWSNRSREASNVIFKHELEVAGSAGLSYRWAEFTTQEPICLRTNLLIPGILVPLTFYRLAIERTARSLGFPNPPKTVIRLAAHGSTPLLLLDNMEILETFLLAAASSPTEWSFVLEASQATPLPTVALRVLNRALSNFDATGTTILRVKEAAISQLFDQ